MGKKEKELSESSQELLSKVFDALSTSERIYALKLFGAQEKISLQDVAEKVGLSRSGFQKVVDKFREVGLIEQAGHRSYYRLTPLGRIVLGMCKEFENKLEPLEKELNQKRLRSSIDVLKEVVERRGLKAQTLKKLQGVIKEIEKEAGK